MYREFQCIMVNGNMGTPALFPCEQTDTTENITFPQLRWRAIVNERLSQYRNVAETILDDCSSLITSDVAKQLPRTPNF